MDWVIQLDPPDDSRSFIHRAGRTGRAGKSGKNEHYSFHLPSRGFAKIMIGRCLLVLQPSEVRFVKILEEARVPIVEFEFPEKKLLNIQSQLEKLIASNYYLNKSAKDAFR